MRLAKILQIVYIWVTELVCWFFALCTRSVKNWNMVNFNNSIASSFIQLFFTDTGLFKWMSSKLNKTKIHRCCCFCSFHIIKINNRTCCEDWLGSCLLIILKYILFLQIFWTRFQNNLKLVSLPDTTMTDFDMASSDSDDHNDSDDEVKLTGSYNLQK